MSDEKVVSIGAAPLSAKEKLDLYCEGLADGLNKTQAYVAAGFSPNHAQRNVAAYHRKHSEYINAFISERIGSHVPMALRVIVSIAEDPNEKGGIRLKAAQDILDRGGFGAKQKVELTTKNVEDMSAEDLMNEVRRILDEEPDLAKVLSFPTA
ncbi:ORF.01 [Pseudomonas phage PaP3]|uniref:ORF.01 n=1 Tax=Pseudomonas phage PaP3 TaxID=2905964 RepID=Q8H9R5_9CAUD|nr:terminase small subunit [Pseudomonas phage PaP3]6W7T_A Chain A, small terminase subunit [Bruynoghevirus PaP3]6W7T_B Chain B, small terminase subunit [Bruynoghevirus PaP3]6W7T_C Chain C, small terminase subunit [Bruynoghevirus PaP3]6W7T_D Chain D, small terminase subunit [Bruynoghevirus PaP3]6W7T_E Chain E, small terminase subunit [Bruynoghevirus PaP3]6W7T_F Chain F, small terminase subunit [Bruynoghevirus PaP3]6W7T_G Chain G, small terminase subunit [Bruynoghevirus PaP3]6W7T_H Chain H, s